MRVRVSAIIIAVVLCAIAAHAFTFETSLSPADVSVKRGETAHFNLTITHNDSVPHTFSVYSPEVYWDVPSKSITVAPGEAGVVDIEVRQYPRALNPGYHLINIHIRPAGEDQLERQSVLVQLRSDTVTGYVPSLRVVPTIPARLVPDVTSLIRIDLTSLNRLDLSDLVLKVRSGLINIDRTASVKGLDSTTVEIPFTLPVRTAPQQDLLRVTAVAQVGNQTYNFDVAPIAYDVVETGEIAAEEGAVAGVLRRSRVITFTNTGNSRKTTTYLSRKPFLLSLFMESEPGSRIIHDEHGSWFAWDVTLDAGASTTITLTADYMPLVWLLVAAAVAFLLYYWLRSPIVVEKKAIVIGTREGGVTDLKILIEIRNRSAGVLKEVKLLDRVPRIAEFVQDPSVSALRPAQVLREDKHGTLLRWNIHGLDRFEQRAVSYRIRTKLSILGRLHLPVAVVKFEPRPGKVRSTPSNVSHIGFGK